MKKHELSLCLFCIFVFTFATVTCSRTPSDTQLTSQVQTALNQDSALASKHIAVQSNAGTVSLSGEVGSEAERSAAERLTSQIFGVKRVVNNLTVLAVASPVPAASQNTSTELAKPSPATTTQAKRPTTSKSLKSSTSTSQPAAKPSTPASAVPVAVTPVPVIVPKGTNVSVRLIDPVDTAKNKEGDTFRASLDSPIVVDEKTIVPKNSDVEARLVSAKSAGHFTGSSSVVLVLTKLFLGKTQYDIRTGEFTKQGASRGKRTAIVVGGGTAAGAVIGGIVGGGKGAAIGAAAGAAAGAGVQGTTKGQQIQLPSETLLEFQLAEPLTVTPKAGESPGQ